MSSQNMLKQNCVAAYFLLVTTLFLPFTVSAEPTAARLTAKAENVRTSGTPLLVTIVHIFDKKPETDCNVRLYGKLTHTDGSDADTSKRFRIAKKVATKKKVTFSYRGPAIRLSQGDQTQLNLQTVSRCPGLTVDVVSSVAAVNVTCRRGVASSDFKGLLTDRTRSVSIPRTSRNTGTCQ